MKTENVRQFMEDDNGVHVMNDEHTLCGDALDAWLSERDWEDGEMKETKKKTVTCQKCIAIIVMLKGIRIKQPENARR